MMALLFIGALMLSSCKKELQIEKNLWKNGGEWNIVQNDETTIRSNGDNDNSTTYNNGTMIFKKDGTGVLTIVDGSDTETMSFNYTNTQDKLIVTHDNESQTYDMEWSKNKMTLTWRTSWMDFINNEQVDVKYTTVIKLEKK